MGSTVEVVVKHRKAAMVYADLDIVLSSTLFVGWDVCAVWPAKRERDILVWVFCLREKLLFFETGPTIELDSLAVYF